MAASSLAQNKSIIKSKSYFTLGSAHGSDINEKAINEKPSREANDDRPLPTDFDAFVPLVCLQWEVPQVVKVIRRTKAIYIPFVNRRKSERKVKLKETTSEVKTSSSLIGSVMPPTASDDNADSVIITSYYEHHSHLTEVSIVGCRFKIPLLVIKALNSCFPFHKTLTKLTIRRGGLSDAVLKNIAKELHNSYITEICLDDSYIKQGNYYVLLDQPSQLKYLSLCRCRINDTVIQEIASRIAFGGTASKQLQILDLTSNIITDLGAQTLAEVLRKNRSLIHLNLAGNQISDTGANSLLETLMEFTLTDEEVWDTKVRKSKYIEFRRQVQEQCLQEELMYRLSLKHSIVPAKTSKVSKKKSTVTYDDPNFLEIMTNQIAGERFKDVFDDNSVVRKMGRVYSRGNFKLASLNLAYNNLEFPSVKKIVNVLKYQRQVLIDHKEGLLKIVIDGNNIPDNCFQYEMIDAYLRNKMSEIVPTTTSSSKKGCLDKDKSRRISTQTVLS